jgi:integrase
VAKRCIEACKPHYSATTIRERERKLDLIGRELESLRKAGLARQTDPRRMTEAEVGALLTLWKQRSLDPTTQHSYLRWLSWVLDLCENPVVRRMRTRRVPLPKELVKESVALSLADLRRIWAACETLDGWTGDVARFIFRAYPFTGLRNKELRLAHFEDLDTRAWTLRVRHPKGEGVWGQARIVPIPPPLREPVLDFLRARSEWLAAQSLENATPLIPSPCTQQADGTPGPYTHHGFERMKLRVERASGVRFKIKDLRSTGAQILKDMGVPIEAVSKQLGHASAMTTEKYYARIRDAAAHREINEAWERAVSQ